MWGRNLPDKGLIGYTRVYDKARSRVWDNGPCDVSGLFRLKGSARSTVFISSATAVEAP